MNFVYSSVSGSYISCEKQNIFTIICNGIHYTEPVSNYYLNVVSGKAHSLHSRLDQNLIPIEFDPQQDSIISLEEFKTYQTKTKSQNKSKTNDCDLSIKDYNNLHKINLVSVDKSKLESKQYYQLESQVTIDLDHKNSHPIFKYFFELRLKKLDSITRPSLLWFIKVDTSIIPNFPHPSHKRTLHNLVLHALADVYKQNQSNQVIDGLYRFIPSNLTFQLKYKQPPTDFSHSQFYLELAKLIRKQSLSDCLSKLGFKPIETMQVDLDLDLNQTLTQEKKIKM